MYLHIYTYIYMDVIYIYIFMYVSGGLNGFLNDYNGLSQRGRLFALPTPRLWRPVLMKTGFLNGTLS